MTGSIKRIVLFAGLPLAAASQQNAALSAFTGAQVKDSVFLSFTMNGGYTCNGIGVQRGTDTLHFALIGDIQGVCGSPVFETSYTFTDPAPVDNTVNHYRLDLGNYGYSPVLPVFFKKLNAHGFALSANPCAGDCTMYFENAQNKALTVRIFDTNGHLQVSETVHGRSYSLKPAFPARGLYHYMVLSGNDILFAGSWMVAD